MNLSRELLEDVGSELGITEVSLVEKDYRVVEALGLIKDISSPYFTAAFSGGTCLSKIHVDLGRMSEDVDLKLCLTEMGKQLSNSRLKKELSNLKEWLTLKFESANFTVSSQQAKSSNRYITYDLDYKRLGDVHSALRPKIKIEFTVRG